MTISGSLAGPKHSKEEKKENESEKGEAACSKWEEELRGMNSGKLSEGGHVKAKRIAEWGAWWFYCIN